MKCKIQIKRIMFPKREILAGEFAILTGEVLEVLEGDYPKINPRYGTVNMKGNVPHLKEGDIFDFKLGDCESNDFGHTYEIESVSLNFDKNNKEELRNFLQIVCGNSIADELMKLDENPYDLLENKDSEALLKIKGIGEKKLEYIYDQFDCLGDKSIAYTKLIPLGLTKKIVNIMCNRLGGALGAIDVCFNNPYLLVDRVKGIGFKKADEIAFKTGYTNPFLRNKYAILFILETKGEAGKSYLSQWELFQEVVKLTNVDKDFYLSVISNLEQEGRIILSEDKECVSLKKYFELEKSIAESVVELLTAKPLVEVPEDWKEKLENLEKKQGWKFNKQQLIGIETGLYNNICLIKGLAGTGKTTVTSAILEILKEYKIEMCCLSAKASQRLREVTGFDAKTIHRAIGLNNQMEYEPIFAEIIIVDEASMVNGTIFDLLFKAVMRGSKIIIMGDIGQLTAIGNCSVFNDLLNCPFIPTVELTEIHRQAQKSKIITESKKIRSQERIFEKGFKGRKILGELQDLELCVYGEDYDSIKEITETFARELESIGDIMEVQIITPLKSRGEVCTLNINKEIQKKCTVMVGDSFEGMSKTKIYLGDKVINLKNNYNTKGEKGEKRPIWNGSIGRVVSIREKECVIDFIGIGRVVIDKNNYSNIELAYAISCHSSQGSQWKSVICAIDSSAYVLLNVEILYTSITRASKKCCLIIEGVAFEIALGTVENNTKQTLLGYFLENIKPKEMRSIC